MAVFKYSNANYDLPPQNITHIRSSYHANHNSNINRINQE
jgi:hypothetical protein